MMCSEYNLLDLTLDFFLGTRAGFSLQVRSAVSETKASQT